MIDVTDRSDVHVRLAAIEFLFSHFGLPPNFALSADGSEEPGFD
jgi:hypothetical protein